MSRMLANTAWALLLLAVACSDDSSPMDAAADTGADGGGDSMVPPDAGAPYAPEPPRIDWLDEGAPDIAPAAAPVLTPCAAGWREVEIEGVVTCSPWPAAGPGDCPDHEAHFPGTAGCAPVGSTCAADGWPTGLPTSAVVYVRAGATAGDGSRTSPYPRIADATAGAGPGVTIAIASGTYDEAVTVPESVTLAGACPEETRLTHTVTMGGAGGALRNVTIDGAAPGVLVTAAVTVEGVVVRGAQEAGVSVIAGTLIASELSVRDTAAEAPALRIGAGAAATVTRGALTAASGDGVEVTGAAASLTLTDVAVTNAGGRGLSLGPGGAAAVDRSTFEGCAGSAIFQAGDEARLTDVVLRGAETVPASRGGQGLVTNGGATVLDRVLIASSSWAGVEVRRGAVSGTDLAVIGTVPSPTDASSGHGLIAYGGSVDLERAHFAKNAFRAITLSVYSATLTDVVVADTVESAFLADRSTWGAGVDVRSAVSTLTRVRVTDAIGFGLHVWGDGECTLRDVVLTDIEPGAGGASAGSGILLSGPARLTAERVVIERAHHGGVMITAGATADMTDLAVRDISTPTVFATSGISLFAEGASQVTLRRALFERGRLAGIHVIGGASVTAEDLVVREMLGDENLGLHGWGVAATAGGGAQLTRARISETRYVGLLSVGPGSLVEGTEIKLEDTLEARCAVDLCAHAPFGIGVGAYTGGAVSLEGFSITRSNVIGLQLAGGGSIDLANGEVSMNPIGVNVQTEAFEVDRLTHEVSYTNNGQNLVTEALPVPSVGGL